ncbi:MAG TPA: hypothetical protein VFA68_04230 [Terriglobales bacterium]|nr:hypothetical protein [Terriglobales bacterium]
MKQLFLLLTMVLLAGLAFSQTPAPDHGPMQIAPGTAIPAELGKSLDAHKNKPGDPVTAKVVQDLLSNGQVVIPRDTKIVGHVTEATPKSKGEPGSRLGIAFDKMILKGGREVPFRASIQALAKTQEQASPLANEPANSGYGGSAGIGAGSAPGIAGERGGVAGGQAGVQRPTVPDASGYPGTGSTPSGGAISASTQGVIGLKGLALSKGNEGTVVTADSGNVHLDSGTQMILHVEGK